MNGYSTNHFKPIRHHITDDHRHKCVLSMWIGKRSQLDNCLRLQSQKLFGNTSNKSSYFRCFVIRCHFSVAGFMASFTRWNGLYVYFISHPSLTPARSAFFSQEHFLNVTGPAFTKLGKARPTIFPGLCRILF